MRRSYLGSQHVLPPDFALARAMTKPPEVLLYTDGACSGNPGPGGWAFLMVHPATGKELERSGAERETTNNRMELQAVIEGLAVLKRPTRVYFT